MHMRAHAQVMADIHIQGQPAGDSFSFLGIEHSLPVLAAITFTFWAILSAFILYLYQVVDITVSFRLCSLMGIHDKVEWSPWWLRPAG